MEIKKQRYWLNYDLGSPGKYQELYEWLDNMDAVECGEGLATFRSNLNVEDITNALYSVVQGGSYTNSRIYLITHGRGRFIVGKRRRQAIWNGAAFVDINADDEA